MTVPCTNDVTPVSDWWHAGLPLACVSCHGVARPCADSGFAGTIRMQSVAAGGGVGVGVGFGVGFGLGWLFNPAAEAAPPPCGDGRQPRHSTKPGRPPPAAGSRCGDAPDQVACWTKPHVSLPLFPLRRRLARGEMKRGCHAATTVPGLSRARLTVSTPRFSHAEHSTTDALTGVYRAGCESPPAAPAASVSNRTPWARGSELPQLTVHVCRRMYAFQASEPACRPPPVAFSPPNAPPISAPEVPTLTLAIPQSEPATDSHRSAARRSVVKSPLDKPCGT